MMPACPPPPPNPFRVPVRPAPGAMPTLWLDAPRRHASGSWHLAEGNPAGDLSFRWGDEVASKYAVN